MCGIAGFWRRAGLTDGAEHILASMTTAIARRGPDDSGQWLHKETGIALGHRRLSIIDLSPSGHQPMASHCGRYVLILNGEIYNFEDLRAELCETGDAQPWRGHSDTEVLLAGFTAWGIRRTLEKANGMFALALWDRERRVLSLARDRMGEKPLYFGWSGHGPDRALLFGSDLAALKHYPGFSAEINTDALGLLTRYLFVPEPHSIFRGIEKLMPGTYVTFAEDGRQDSVSYWDTLSEFAAASQQNSFMGSADEAVDALEDTLGRAVRRQSIADVPLGAFLSGGIDSSVIVALMQSQASKPVKTFSIGFDEQDHNEAVHARAVAVHLGTEHHELILAPSDALAVIPELPHFYAEPFADSSQIPTYLVAKMAREKVTVALSGDAGDEMFGGYNRYTYTTRYWPILSRLPAKLRRAAGRAISSVPTGTLDRVLGPLVSGQAVNVGEKLHKAAGIFGSQSTDVLYRNLISINQGFDGLMKSRSEVDGFEARNLDAIKGLGSVDRMMALDSVHYLPGDILTKVDRAAMATSLETRVPMLDVDVMRFAWSLPSEVKIRGGKSKWPLRQLLYRHVPEKLVERPKMGFGIPIGPWLRGPLRDWADALLTSCDHHVSDYFDAQEVQKLWQDHQIGLRNNQHQLWPILMFQAWLESQ